MHQWLKISKLVCGDVGTMETPGVVAADSRVALEQNDIRVRPTGNDAQCNHAVRETAANEDQIGIHRCQASLGACIFSINPPLAICSHRKHRKRFGIDSALLHDLVRAQSALDIQFENYGSLMGYRDIPVLQAKTGKMTGVFET